MTWNGSRVLSLVERARAVRQATVVRDGLQSYSADARGYVYFFIDREGSNDRNLVKTDQVALQIFWQAPNQTQQIIVGQRDEEQLPTNINYHLDHLTVVQDDFGDRIRMGDGDEVSEVVHPFAPSSRAVYDFRIADSLTIRFAGPEEAIRVFRIEVRPRDLDAPGFVGSVYVDRATASVVRMRFTFTPASYVDPFLDYIRVSTDNALWDGAFWLPNRQQVEIRREAPFFDFPMGSVIRGRFEISGYRLNEPLPPGLFRGPRVTALSEEARASFEFERGLYDEIEDQGLGPAPDLDQIRDQAADLARDHYLSGLGPLRPYVPGVSSVLRVNRAEGVFIGAGASYKSGLGLGIRAHGGYGLGRDEGQVRVAVDGGERWPRTLLAGFVSEPRDIGPIPAASGAINTLAVLLRTRDYQDLYFTSGILARRGWKPSDPWTLELTARWERHRSGYDALSDSGSTVFRPVRPVDDGELLAVDLDLEWDFGSRFTADGSLTLASFDGTAFSSLHAGIRWTRTWVERRAKVDVRARGGLTTTDSPPQSMFLLGGRGTLPGYPIRSFAGDRFWLLRADAAAAAMWPWLGVRGFVAFGGTDLAGELPVEWVDAMRARARASVGLGVDLFWDVLRVEVGRGVSSGGDWEVNLFSSSRFWPVL